MWGLWPPVPLVDEVHHVVHVDGIHLHRDAVVLIAVAGGHVIGWHVAKSEKAAAWQCLMARIAPPDVLVCDGGGGVLKAAKAMWPDTRIQRCRWPRPFWPDGSTSGCGWRQCRSRRGRGQRPDPP